MATTLNYSFYQVANAYPEGTFDSKYQIAGAIVFDKATHTITICKSESSTDNVRYGGGLKNASFNAASGTLIIEDFDNNSISATVTTPTTLETKLAAYLEKQTFNAFTEAYNTDMAGKADKGTTLENYGITDAYTQKETDAKILEKISLIPDYTIVKAANAEDGYSATYILQQGDEQKGVTINIPKDMVVQSGVIEVNPSGQSEGTYIVLTLANATNDKLYINVTDLIDTYTGSTYISISDDGKVSLNTTMADKRYLTLEGGTLTGQINTQSVIPSATNTYSIGSGSLKYKAMYATDFIGTAAKATADGDGNTISSTYAKTASLVWQELA